MDLKINITLKSIIRLEMLLKKPFISVDFTDTAQVIPFLYCCAISNCDLIITLQEFEELCTNPKILAKLLKAFRKEADQIAQFQNFAESKEDGEPRFIKHTVSTLILAGGLDPDYVLNKMDITLLPMLFEAMNRRDQQAMEQNRLWTYLSMLPHIDAKKLKSPQDLYPFPWEMEEIEKQAEAAIDQNTEMFEKFMNGEIKFKPNVK